MFTNMKLGTKIIASYLTGEGWRTMGDKRGGSKVLVLLAVCTLMGVAVQAQNEDVPELITDRPDQTESSVVILPGYVQIETGILYTKEDEGGEESRTIELPGTLLRIGVVNRLELRIGFTGWVNENEEDEAGFGDSELGLKVYLIEEEGWRPEIALLASVSLPTGESGFSTEEFDPSFRFLFSHTLSDRVSIGYNLGAAWETEERERRSQPGTDPDTMSVFQYTITSGISITDRLGTFVELFGDIPMNAPGKPAHSFDAGFTYLIRDNIQLDIAAGVGLSEDADDWFIGTGVTFRFPR